MYYFRWLPKCQFEWLIFFKIIITNAYLFQAFMLLSLKRMTFFLAMYQLLPNFFTSTSSCECHGKAQNPFVTGRRYEYWIFKITTNESRFGRHSGRAGFYTWRMDSLYDAEVVLIACFCLCSKFWLCKTKALMEVYKWEQSPVGKFKGLFVPLCFFSYGDR